MKLTSALFPLRDKYLRCRDCGIKFVSARAEQEGFREKGFEHEPSRCPTCRLLRRQLRRPSRRGMP